MFGWHSVDQEREVGSHFYSTPDGGEAIVSMVTHEDAPPIGSVFVFHRVGPVVSWLRDAVPARSPWREFISKSGVRDWPAPRI